MRSWFRRETGLGPQLDRWLEEMGQRNNWHQWANQLPRQTMAHRDGLVNARPPLLHDLSPLDPLIFNMDLLVIVASDTDSNNESSGIK